MTRRTDSAAYSPGFTLIELLIYSGILTMIMGACLTSAYSLIRSSGRDQERQAVLENERFIYQKLDWLLSGATSGQIRPASGTAAILEVQRSCSDYTTLSVSGSSLLLRRNSDGDCDVDTQDQSFNLTNNHVQVSGVVFERLVLNGQPTIRMQATLQGTYASTALDKTVYIR